MKGLALDERSGGAHFALGSVKGFYEWDQRAAETELRLGLAYNPDFESYAYSAWLSAMGRFNETVREAKRVVGLNPTSVPGLALLVLVLNDPRRYEEALREINAFIETHPDNSARYQKKAHARLASGADGPGRGSRTDCEERPRAHRRAALSATQLATLYAALGQRDQAFRWLESGLPVRDAGMIQLGTMVELERLHSDSRWADIIHRVQTAGPPP